MTHSVRPAGLTVSRHMWSVVAPILALVLVAAPGTEAHKGITSKYNYNDHVFPILRDRCSRCHFEGGPTPMSLMSYKDAFPWAESIREQLTLEKMPPWYADPTGPAVQGDHTITAKELDILVTWAAGGTPQSAEAKVFIGFGGPQGDADAPGFTAPSLQWESGPPDLTVAMDADYTVAAGTSEEMCEFILPTGLTEEKWVTAADLLPGTPSMVRDAVISVEKGPVLAAWVPGYDGTPAPSGTAFRVPAGTKLRLQIHYKKHWRDEQSAKSDRSTIGLYFADPPLSGQELQALSVDGPEAPPESIEPRKFSGSFKTAARAVAIRPSFDQPYARVDVEAVLPAGRRIPLLRLRAPQPQWYRRYWLAQPIELPKGSTVEVAAIPVPPDEFDVPAPKRYRLQVAVDFVAQ